VIINVAYRPALHLSVPVFVVCITIYDSIVLINVLARSINNLGAHVNSVSKKVNLVVFALFEM
jgi:type III secretory pathway component EscT